MAFPGSRDTEFQIARSEAIESYANIEFVLSKLFAQLLDTDDARGAIVFFRITNARARNNIIDGLLKREHSEKYDVYWNGEPGDGKAIKRTRGLFSLIRALDDRRNEIVHWHLIRSYDITPAGLQKSGEELRSVVSWYKLPGEIQPITTESLKEFIKKSRFVSASIDKFRKITRVPGPAELQSYEPSTPTWLQIFQRPVSYPPPDTHPLFRIHEEP